MHRTLTALLLSCAVPVLGAAQSTSSPAPARIEKGLRPAVRIQNRPDTAYSLAERMRHYRVPGVSIAVVDRNRVVWAGGFGVTRSGGANAVDTTTLFQGGSLSKSIAATTALALVDRNTLRLDEEVNSRLKAWRVRDVAGKDVAGVTLRRLLSHNAGVTVPSFPGYAAGAAVPSWTAILDGAAPARTAAIRVDTTPGSIWRYSGGGYLIAQALVTEQTGQPFPRVAERLVFGPLGMRNSTFEQPLPTVRAARAATGHERRDTAVAGGSWTYPELAAAGLWTTAPDLARWAAGISAAFQGRRGSVLSPTVAREMLRPHVPLPAGLPNPLSESWGLGVALAGAGDSLRFTHIGRNEGFLTLLVMYPARGQGIVVMTNGTSFPLISEIVRAFDAEYGLATQPRTVRTEATLAPAALDDFTGRYLIVRGADSTTYSVARAGGALSLSSSRGVSRVLRPQAQNAFFDQDNGAAFTFVRAEDGRVRSLMIPSPRGPEAATRLP